MNNKLRYPYLNEINDDFEQWLIALQEHRVTSYVSVAAACLAAVESGDVLTASKLFSQKTGWVRRRAYVYTLICNVFGGEETFLPQIPLSLYETAAKTNDPKHWLQMATDPEYRQDATGEDDGLNIWSARHLSDEAGLSESKTVSDVPLIPAGAEGFPTVWENRVDADGVVAAYVEMVLPDVSLSGKVPERVRLGKVVEILTQKGDSNEKRN